MLHVGRAGPIIKLLPRFALRGQPLGVGILRPIGLGMMRPVEDLVSIVDALFRDAIGAGGEMQLAGKAASVAGVGEEAADEFFG